MEDYRESHVPMLGISLPMNKHYTIHQKEFKASKGQVSEHGSTSLRQEERVPDLGLSLMQGTHEHFRKPKGHRLNWRSKKLTSATKEEERAEEASENIPDLGISLHQRSHETIRHHPFKAASPSKEEKKE